MGEQYYNADQSLSQVLDDELEALRVINVSQDGEPRPTSHLPLAAVSTSLSEFKYLLMQVGSKVKRVRVDCGV